MCLCSGQSCISQKKSKMVKRGDWSLRTCSSWSLELNQVVVNEVSTYFMEALKLYAAQTLFFNVCTGL